MLKFANTAKIGDIIKAYDFMPMEGRPDCFLAGRVVAKGACYKELENGHKVYLCEGYTVEVLGGDEESREFRKGATMFVPFEMDFMEFDNRVSVVVTAEEVEMAIAYETNEAFH